MIGGNEASVRITSVQQAKIAISCMIKNENQVDQQRRSYLSTNDDVGGSWKQEEHRNSDI